MFKETIFAGLVLFFVSACVTGADIKFVQDTNKIDILIGGNLFTTYRYGYRSGLFRTRSPPPSPPTTT